ncbi:hypothetical protein [Atlantibacter sp.]|uniref:hypothetical protein n=1 Tax=Atlantibacter sp. TaxID=1903473 RepID=UPI0028B1F1DA|nr:hypothetical protein [Atlantibacter sp.]
MSKKMPHTGRLWQGFSACLSEKFNGRCGLLKKGQDLSVIIDELSIKPLFN